MDHYAGIDVSLEQSSICIVDATGRIVREAKVASEPLTPSRAVAQLRNHPRLRQGVVEALVERASPGQPTGGTDALKARIEQLLDDWDAVARERVQAGGTFTYDDGGAERRLLQYPLDPASQNLLPAHQAFVAARSMRDVEPASYLKVRGPEGREIVGAQDLP